MVYLNLYQKYILEQLQKYGGLLTRQLEFMTKRFVEPYLLNVDGYLKQLRWFNRIEFTEYMGEEAVMLPGQCIDADIISSVDVMLKFAEYIVRHDRGCPPVSIRFFINTELKLTQEVNILPVERGREREAEYYAESYITELQPEDKQAGQLPEWIFLLQNKKQMRLIQPNAEYSFAVMEENKPVFYRDTKIKQKGTLNVFEVSSISEGRTVLFCFTGVTEKNV